MRASLVSVVSLGLLASLISSSACSSSEGAKESPVDSGISDASPGPDSGVNTDAGAPAPLCPDGKTKAGDFPEGPYGFAIEDTLADRSFVTAEGKISLRGSFEPCAAESRLLVLRISTAWCGPCRWQAAHTKALKDAPIRVLDLLVDGADGAPASVADLASWRARIDAPDDVALLGDNALFAINPSRLPLPLIVLVDTRTMKIANYLNDPDPDLLKFRIADELAILNKKPRPAYPKIDFKDGVFTTNQWDLLREMAIPGPPPPDPSNAKGDDAAASALGSDFFVETALSPASISCTTCHAPAKYFTDERKQSVGVSQVDRNAPTSFLAAYSPFQFWDGRADSLWSQALGPPENPKEMGSNRVFLVRGLFNRYKARYEAVFGALPDMSDTARFPENGKPGDASWAAMAEADKKAVTRAYVNYGKALDAFQRTLKPTPNALDKYIGGDLTALTTAQKNGLATFFTAGCAQCHYGPRLTDDAFHNVRFPTGRRDGAADRGRIDAFLQAPEFDRSSEYSDAPTPKVPFVAYPNLLGAFKTPALRGVTASSPYGHGGESATLRDVVTLYSTAGLPPGDARTTGEIPPWLPQMAAHHIDELTDFLGV